MPNQSILSEVRTLEAYFASGLKEATRLRKKLEGDSSPSSSRKGGLTDEQKAKVLTHRHKTIMKVS